MILRAALISVTLLPSLSSAQFGSSAQSAQSNPSTGAAPANNSGLIAPNFQIPIAPNVQLGGAAPNPYSANSPSNAASSGFATGPAQGSMPGASIGGSGNSAIPGLVAPQIGLPFQRPSSGPPGSLGTLNTGSTFPSGLSPFGNPAANPPRPVRELKAPPVVTYDPRTATRVKPIIAVKTSEGEFKLRLDPNLAPRNVENFVDLAMGRKEFVDSQTSKKVKRPFYTGLLCHKILKNVLVQCGCPFGNGRGGPGFFLPDELSEQSRLDREGLIAMAPVNTQPDGKRNYQVNSNGSQFFITLGPWPEPEEKFTVIGSVIEGMSVIRKISRIPVGPTDRPLKRVIIYSIDVENEPQVQIEDPAKPTNPGLILGNGQMPGPESSSNPRTGRAEPTPGEMDQDDPLSGGIQ